MIFPVFLFTVRLICQLCGGKFSLIFMRASVLFFDVQVQKKKGFMTLEITKLFFINL